MRVGLMVGTDRDCPPAERLGRLLSTAQSAEDHGFASFWFPQVPGYLDAMSVLALIGQRTKHIELGTAIVPIQTRHPIAMAQQALTTGAACAGRFTLGLGPSHHWIIEDQLGLSYDRPAHQVRDYLQVLGPALRAPGPVEVENDTYRVRSPLDVTDTGPPQVLLAALGPAMLRLAGEHTQGTILWMADERAVAEHVVPRITAAAQAAGRGSPRVVAGVPVALCAAGEVDRARAHANQVLGHAELSPNYLKLLERGDATDVGDTMAAGDEAAILARLGRYRDAGVTDLAARVIALGDSAAARSESRCRTEEFLATVGFGAAG
ncbi:TIGR03564 family F420-dependent LLM class oxidoreductase [Mycobacterium rhizamassiliense]|nr:TIGR03564 family F420-dependent LLM class oxidoreductase [Mycobacterium rhizamassiliense]